MKTEAIRSGSASLLAFRPSEPRGRRGREGGRRGSVFGSIFTSVDHRRPGRGRYSQKSWEKRNLAESFREQSSSSSSFVSQKDTRGHVNLVSIPISLSSSLPRNEAVCLYIIRRCIGYSWTPTSPFYNHNPGQRIYAFNITNPWKPGRILPSIPSVYNP